MGALKLEPKKRGRKAPAERPQEDSRSAILKAALFEFAAEGVAGARTERIASAAGVNIAMLFYHFKNKEQLYGAVLEQVFVGLTQAVLPALERKASPTERLLAYIRAHFDYVAESPTRPCLVQREMMRAGRSGSPHLRKLVKLYFAPIQDKFTALLEEGMASGEFHEADRQNLLYSIAGVINSYFTSRPVIEVLSGTNPLTPARIEKRKQQVIQFLSNALLRGSPRIADAGKNGLEGKARNEQV